MSFADFPDQQQVVSLLQRSLERGRLGHAYLFTGDQMPALEAVASTLAKTLNCQSPRRAGAGGVPVDCCGACLSCRKIDRLIHADVQWVRAESKSRVIRIEQIRTLLESVYLKPTEAAWKVAVIVAADRLNDAAANAFLKTLEEPPPSSILILLSTDPQRLLETILSRCLRLNFASDGAVKFDSAQLAWVAAFSEAVTVGERGLLARYRLLGKLLEQLGQMKEEIETALTERSPLERYDDVDPDLKEKWEDELSASIEAEYRRRRTDLLVGLQWWLRDVWLQTLALGDELVCFPHLAAAARAVAVRISPGDAAENLRVLEETQRLLGSNVQEALALEVGLLKLKV